MAPQHPEWKKEQPFKKLFATLGDELAPVTERELLHVVMASHAGMTVAEFDRTLRDWFATARHPKTGRLYTEMVYQPMVELLNYLRANGFKNLTVSGGGIEFMRPWTEKVYGIPPEHVVGSSGKLKYLVADDKTFADEAP